MFTLFATHPGLYSRKKWHWPLIQSSSLFQVCPDQSDHRWTSSSLPKLQGIHLRTLWQRHRVRSKWPLRSHRNLSLLLKARKMQKKMLYFLTKKVLWLDRTNKIKILEFNWNNTQKSNSSLYGFQIKRMVTNRCKCKCHVNRPRKMSKANKRNWNQNINDYSLEI